jgi:hypothetical protein
MTVQRPCVVKLNGRWFSDLSFVFSLNDGFQQKNVQQPIIAGPEFLRMLMTQVLRRCVPHHDNNLVRVSGNKFLVTTLGT